MDLRLKYLNEKGIIGGLVVAWGDKRRDEPYSWHRFPSLEARKRYARYIAARYSAYEVYFIVSGEWNGEYLNRKTMGREAVKAEFIEIGSVLAEADIHDRMGSGYPIKGYGTSYMGGYRDPGPFNPDDPRNLVWAAQYHLAQHFLSQLKWWKPPVTDDWVLTISRSKF